MVAVIDTRSVITGSFNWSPSAAHQNDEVLLLIESPLLAAHFSREMDRLWRGAGSGDPPCPGTVSAATLMGSIVRRPAGG